MGWNGDYYAHHDGHPEDTYSGSYEHDTGPYYKYEFHDEEALVTSKIFQKYLGMGLAHKDKIIRELQQELLDVESSGCYKCGKY